MPRRALVPRSILVVLLLLAFVPAFAGKNKTKSTPEKQHQDFSKFVDIPGASKMGADQCTACHGEVAKKYGLEQAYSDDDYEKALFSVDVVYIALPNHLHREYAVRAAFGGLR